MNQPAVIEVPVPQRVRGQQTCPLLRGQTFSLCSPFTGEPPVRWGYRRHGQQHGVAQRRGPAVLAGPPHGSTGRSR